MARLSRRVWYERVNAAWPAGTLPALTGPEAIRAAKKLYRFAIGHTWRGEVRLTTGNRATWERGGVLYVNASRGWSSLVHLMSHLADVWQRPRDHGHDNQHAKLELRMVKEVVRRGWLDGKLKDKPRTVKPPPTPQEALGLKYARAAAALRRAQTRLKRATTLHRKALRRMTYYARRVEAS